MKTKLSDGIIMFGGVPENDWIIVELVDDIVRYSSQTDGRFGLVTAMNLPLPVDRPHTWHDVTIQRLSPSNHVLRVDNVSTADMMPSSADSRPVRSPQFPLIPPTGDINVPVTPITVVESDDTRQVLTSNQTVNSSSSLPIGVYIKRSRTSRTPEQIRDVMWSPLLTSGADDLFIGGVPNAILKSLQPGSVQSHNGFQGCLASINLNGDGRSLRSRGYQVPEEHSHNVIEGCEGNG